MSSKYLHPARTGCIGESGTARELSESCKQLSVDARSNVNLKSVNLGSSAQRTKRGRRNRASRGSLFQTSERGPVLRRFQM